MYVGSAVYGSSFSATEIGSTGEYLASVPPNTPYGLYLVVASGANGKINSGSLYWDGAKEINPFFYDELYRLQGLKLGQPMTVTPSSRTVGSISLAITGNGVSESVVTRQ